MSNVSASALHEYDACVSQFTIATFSLKKKLNVNAVIKEKVSNALERLYGSADHVHMVCANLHRTVCALFNRKHSH